MTRRDVALSARPRRMLWSLQTDRGDVDAWLFVRRERGDPSWLVTIRGECRFGTSTLRIVCKMRREYTTERDLQQHVAAMADRLRRDGVRVFDGRQVIP